jgi:hypothetical protein
MVPDFPDIPLTGVSSVPPALFVSAAFLLAMSKECVQQLPLADFF